MNKSATNMENLEKEKAIAVREPSPIEIFANAVDRGIDIEKMKVLREMVEWHEDREAEKAFNKAMAAFRAEVIPIIKNRTVDYTPRTGGRVNYMHETLDAVLDAAVPRMAAFGLYHRWETQQEGEKIHVTCIVGHDQGHGIRVALSASPDQTGSKNAIQAVGSTVKYLERYTFMAATGLAAKGHDTDGRPPVDDETITAAQLKIVSKLVKDTNTDIDAFLEWVSEGLGRKIEKLDDLPSAELDRCMAMLNRKKRKNAEPSQ